MEKTVITVSMPEPNLMKTERSSQNGGRVLGVTAKGATLKEARANAYAATEWVDFREQIYAP